MSDQPWQKDVRVQREQIKEAIQYPLLCFKNAWYPTFFIHHDLAGKDEVPAVDVIESIGGSEDELTTFLHVSKELGSLCDADEVKRYCEGVRLEDIKNGVGEAGTRRLAWVDDRNSPFLTGSGNARLCENPLTATGLLKYLKQPVGTRPKLSPLLAKLLADIVAALQ
jgi:hypothetical protein